ncbi:MAG: hypothetical protein Q9167_007500 [Letrouitia subvulpina]
MKLASSTNKARTLFARIAEPIYSLKPSSLGYPSQETQSAYYPGSHQTSAEEIAYVSQTMEINGILPENTRIRKTFRDGKVVFELLQASVETSDSSQELNTQNPIGVIRVVKGDHSQELQSICSHLQLATQHATNPRQRQFLEQYQQSFQTGDLEVYRQSQKTWVRDIAPAVENIFGFVENYRDPHGIRSEFEGLVAISDREETSVLTKLVQQSSVFIRRLPWTEGFLGNEGRGPFEKNLFKPPAFTSIHALAYCSSTLFGGINLPNYNDIRQECGFKNFVIANRRSAEANEADISPFVHPDDVQTFQKYKYTAFYICLALHELLGHGLGRMMTEEDGKFNFDRANPPINPLTKSPITSWYRPGQTWTSVFADLATAVEECRAQLVGAYLMDSPDLPALFGYPLSTDTATQDLTYNLYIQLGVDGLRGLQDFNVEAEKWGQAHSRGYFAILKCLLREGNGVMKVHCDSQKDQLTVSVDRDRIKTDGKQALRGMLLRLHIYRCTADVESCRPYFEDLSKVDGDFLEWRRIVMVKRKPKWTFVQANSFIENDQVVLREYEATTTGVIQSWAEREV